MKFGKFLIRILLVIALFAFHYLVLFIPSTEVFLIYVLFANPKYGSGTYWKIRYTIPLVRQFIKKSQSPIFSRT